ncbi:MAG TPA: YgcG family protein [Rhodanobacteraceae bacterium]|nr:YgcG family protein [Rhodanobacteraceae bacterium]
MLVTGAVALVALAFADEPIPSLTARVTDITGTLSAPQRKALDDKLAALESRKGAQVAVLIVPTTAPETIEQYATRVFDAWKLGRKGVDDGVLIVVAKNDRRTRIEVAYGLEGAIPDAAAKRIAHDYMSPKFRAGDFAGGLDAGTQALIALIDDEPLPPPPEEAYRDLTSMPWWNPLYFAVGLLVGGLFSVLTLILFTRPRIHRALLGRMPARARPFAIGAVNALPVGILFRNPLTMLAALLTGAGLAAVAGLAQPPKPLRRGRGGGGGWSSSSGDSGGSSSGSGSSSGGSFSGGGGSSGGGGASDSW